MTRISDETNENVASRTTPSGDNVRLDALESTETNRVFAAKRPNICSFVMSMLQLFTQGKTKCPPRPDGHDPKNRVSVGVRKRITGCWNLLPDICPRWKGARFLPKPTRLTIRYLCRTFTGKDSVSHYYKHQESGAHPIDSGLIAANAVGIAMPGNVDTKSGVEL